MPRVDLYYEERAEIERIRNKMQTELERTVSFQEAETRYRCHFRTKWLENNQAIIEKHMKQESAKKVPWWVEY